MINRYILPKFLKEIVQHIPTLAMKSIDWKSVFKELGPFILKMGNPHLDDKKVGWLQKLKISRLKIVKNISEEYLSEEEKNHLGQKVLEIYFSQLKNEYGLNLDLRHKHFTYNNGITYWAPNNMWYQMADEFRLALIDLYKGFYHDEESLFEDALKKIGLTKDLSPDQSKKLIQLFHAHFGPGDQDKVKFEIEKFQDSFYQLFKFFMEEEVKLSKDFIFLGIYLVTLYLHLEKLDLEFDVRQAFLRVFPKSLD